jgi:phage repressor protein C with HTH and peptisase S24 domain
MPAAVLPFISAPRSAGADKSKHSAFWAIFEIAPSGRQPVPYGILLVDRETKKLTFRLRNSSCFDELEEQEWDILSALPDDLRRKGEEIGGLKVLDWFEDGLSDFFRINDRSGIVYSGDAEATVNRLFYEFVDTEVRPFVSHLPVYKLRAAATKFGEQMEDEQAPDTWIRTPENLRLHEGMFVAHVVGCSMEPLIPDGSACIFRAPVTGSRRGRFLLIEKLGAAEASRYTVKRYARQGNLVESAEREGAVRLEPLNRDFEAFDLTEDEFRVIAEFVQVLPS